MFKPHFTFVLILSPLLFLPGCKFEQSRGNFIAPGSQNNQPVSPTPVNTSTPIPDSTATPTPTLTPTIPQLGVELIDTSLQSVIRTVSANSTVTMQASPNLSLKLKDIPPNVRSVRFSVSETSLQRTENYAPFGLCGDDGTNVLACAFLGSAGTYTVDVDSFDGPDATGSIVATFRVTLKIESLATPSPTPTSCSGARTFYIAPNGADTSSGLTVTTPFRTFGYAFSKLRAGDTLILLNGKYHDSLSPTVDGTTSCPITIRAQNDGQAVIDGINPSTGAADLIPIYIRARNNIAIEGIVAANSSKGVVTIEAGAMDPMTGDYARSSNIVFKRVSAYNVACQGCNYHIWDISYADNVLVEDCVGAGRGRTASTFLGTSNVTVRRCWFRADEGTGWSSSIGDHHGLQTYNSWNMTTENVIFADPIPNAFPTSDGLFNWNNAYPYTNTNNRYFGNIMHNIYGQAYIVGAVQCKLSRDHIYSNNVAIFDKPGAPGSRIGMAIRNGRNVVADHFTLIGDTFGSNSSAAGAGIDWVSNPENATYPDCSPPAPNPLPPGFQLWGYFKDPGSSVPTSHSGFDFTSEVKNSIVQGFKNGLYADVHVGVTPIVNFHHNSVNGNGTNYITNPSTFTTASPFGAVNWNTAKYGRGAYLIGPTGGPTGDDGKAVGAQVLYRIENGAVTTRPLWPFPMEDRIWNETAIYTQGQQSATYQDNAQFPGRNGGIWKTLDGVYP